MANENSELKDRLTKKLLQQMKKGAPKEEEIKKALEGTDKEELLILLIGTKDEVKEKVWNRLKELNPTKEEVKIVVEQFTTQMVLTPTYLKIRGESIDLLKSMQTEQ